MNRDTILRARALIGALTPMLSDCGALCGAACCRPDADGQGGVYLFPGEEALLEDCGWGEIVPDAFAPMLMCRGPCDRERRPLACRMFPLTPVRGRDGLWTVRTDARARVPAGRPGPEGAGSPIPPRRAPGTAPDRLGGRRRGLS